MYTLILVLSIIAVVLSPIAIDWYLNVHEARADRRDRRARRKAASSPIIWAPRSR